MSLLIQNATLNGERADCLIEDGRYTAIAPRV